MSATMRAIQTTADAPLRLAEIPRPVAGRNEIVIEIHAAGLNRADLLQRQGLYPPPPGAPETMGLECAGIVAEVGEGVTRWSVGDRVCALLAGGGYAEAVAVDLGSVLPIPDGMDFLDAACLPEAVLTVWANVFDRCGLKPGEAFLCQGGTSGIGVMAIQMARVMGAAPIFATAGRPDKVEAMRALGATHPINYAEEDFQSVIKAEGGVDVILDMVGGDYVQKHIDVIRVDGRICNIAFLGGSKVEVDLIRLMLKRGILTGTTLRARPAEEKRRLRDGVEAQIWPAIVRGEIRPVRDSTFPLAEADAAHARLSAGGHIGKIILDVRG